jgi:ankyrin repeat protein
MPTWKTSTPSAVIAGLPHMRHYILDTASALPEHGADTNSGGRDGRTPLVRTYDCQSLDAMRLLLARGANPDVRHGSIGLLSHHASYHGRTDIVQQHDTDLCARRSKSWTPLHWVSAGHAEIARVLLEHGPMSTHNQIRSERAYSGRV